MKKICDDLNSYFPAACEDCGYICCSSQWEGGAQLGDTGDYGEIYCPRCGGSNITEIDNEQPPQSQLPYDVILNQRKCIDKLEDEMIDLAYPRPFKVRQAVIREGWEYAGRQLTVIGPTVIVNGMLWVPIVFEDEDEPDLYKESSIKFL